MTSTKQEVKPKDLTDNGPTGLNTEDTEVIPSGNHLEIPESPNYFMDIKRKQNNDKMFLELQLLGPKGSKNFRVKLEYPDYDMRVPDLIDTAVKSLQTYKRDYKAAQKRAMILTPSLEDFFLV